MLCGRSWLQGARAGPVKGTAALAQIRHKELSYRVVGCAQRVHRVLGPGCPEAVYGKALRHELARAKLPFQSEKAIEVWYEGVLCGEFRLDLVVAERVVVELKALKDLDNDHLAQALSYLKASGLALGLLLNFGTASLQAQRVVL